MLIMKLLPILSIVITLSSGSLAWYGFGKRRLAQNEPTRKTKGDVFEEQWFSQMLDHYDPSATKMWKQVSSFENSYLMSERAKKEKQHTIRKLALTALLRERSILQRRWTDFPDDQRRTGSSTGLDS